MNSRIITINRMYGSCGRQIAKSLGELLGIHYYDNELLKIAEEREGIPYEELIKVDEKRASSWRYPVEDEIQMEKKFRFEPLNDVLFKTQREIILELAKKEDCIFVGRCANFILREEQNCKSVFLYAPFEKRVEEIMNRTPADEKMAKMMVKRMDKQRKYYYNYFTDEQWNDMEQYDVCIDTSRVSRKQILLMLSTLYENM